MGSSANQSPDPGLDVSGTPAPGLRPSQPGHAGLETLTTPICQSFPNETSYPVSLADISRGWASCQEWGPSLCPAFTHGETMVPGGPKGAPNLPSPLTSPGKSGEFSKKKKAGASCVLIHSSHTSAPRGGSHVHPHLSDEETQHPGCLAPDPGSE